MPFYEYSCPGCGARFDLMRPIADRDRPAVCPKCGRKGAHRELPHVQATTHGETGCGSRGGPFT